MGCKVAATGLADYGNRTKESYRGWWINRVCQRLWDTHKPNMPIPSLKSRAFRDIAATAVVLYLVGPDDVDREYLCRRGFRHENIIAIDRSAKCVANVRRQRHLAIQGDLWEILAAWPADWPVDVIHVDLCGGLTEPTKYIAEALMHFRGGRSILGGAMQCVVLSLNIMHGRDPTSNDWREQILNAAHKSDIGIPDSELKHRGALWLVGYMKELYVWNRLRGDDAKTLWHWCRPVFCKYPSNKVWMDPMVTRLVTGTFQATARRGRCFRWTPTGVTLSGWFRKVERAEKRIRAIRAVRTRRERGH